jgi:REP element-mobilizing transposase RayT
MLQLEPEQNQPWKMRTSRDPHSRDLRRGRASIPGQIYLITTVTKARAQVFADLQCGRILVRTLRHQHETGAVESLAFVVMPDHLHWLFALGDSSSLSKVVGSTKRFSAQEINRLEGTPGRALWQDGFHDRAVRREEDLKDVARYIIANPMRAGLVRRVGDYPLWDACWI